MGAPIATGYDNSLLAKQRTAGYGANGSGIPGAPSMYQTNTLTGGTSPGMQGVNWNNPYAGTAQTSLNTLNGQIGQLWTQPGLTARQKLLMQNQAAQTTAAQKMGQGDAMREQLARMGLSSSGYGAASQAGIIREADAGLANRLSNIEMEDARMALENRFRAAGMNQQATALAGQLASDYERQQEGRREYDNSMLQRQHEYDSGQAMAATQYNNEMARTRNLDEMNRAAFLQQKAEEDEMMDVIRQRRSGGSAGIGAGRSPWTGSGSSYFSYGWR